jgi:succinate dehydrogenase / fumarate reductase membrane anchor subunit
MKSSTAWSWHLLAGLALAFLLGMHMSVMHLDDVLNLLGGEGMKAVSFAAVAQRSQQAFFAVTYILLLAAALFHGLYGLRTVLFELTLAPRVEKLVTVVFVLLGVALFIYGTSAVFTAYQMA